ncbi:MAG: rhodanese-like domain-containing protein [Erysipelotrichia bacterium]|nr:rhodanese-like domain-containing protein [Erysipelotrichia bacterium]
MKRRNLLIIAIVGFIIGSILYFINPGRTVSVPTPAQTTEPAAAFQIISAEEAKSMMDSSETVIVDVRRQDEYDAGHIENAMLIPNESIGNTAPTELADKDAVILVYCRTGIRARDASQKLADLGYTNVYDFGGISTWPFETVK